MSFPFKIYLFDVLTISFVSLRNINFVENIVIVDVDVKYREREYRCPR